jgi:acyl carrier protein
MPPIKGCINAAMVLQDAMFENMAHAQWELTINSKVHTTWNLHNLLPDDIDFFVCLSSICGIMGSLGQCNYAAGCTFQDAIAQYRVSQGKKAVSVDVGWIRDIGIISEKELYQEHRRKARDLRELDGIALIALLSMYCDPSLPLLSLPKSQILIGLATPADYLAKGESVPLILNRPLLAAFSQITGQQSASDQTVAVDPAVLFSKATSKEEKSEVVKGALATKLARAISISPDDVDASKPLSEYGVDSLMAVELRNWIGKDFHASVAVFDILGGTPIASIADLVAERSTVGKAK